jgi:glyoxylase-like metal-dependent hydrolase (beta-lactamase superfamily II)
MLKRLSLAIGLVAALAACSSPKTATSVLQDAQTALGDVMTIRYAGSGTNGNFGQALTAGEAWPLRDLSGYSRAINFEQRSAQDDLNFAEPVFGGQQQIQVVNGDKAWNVSPNGPAPNLAAAEERQLNIWMTPQGFVKAGLAAADAMLTPGEGSSTVSFTAMGKYKLEGTIDAANHVTSVKTMVPNPVLGDTALVTTYSDYKDFNGVQFPGRIQISEGDSPIWDLTITEVTANVPVDLAVPEAVQAAVMPPVQVATTMLAPGVWFLGGGSHHSLVVEFADYITVIEAPLSEERSMAVIAEAKKLVPNKPIKYLVTTHHHFDHTGGLRTYVAEGATVVTHQSNVAYFERAAMAPATLMPDMQAKSPKQAMFQGVSEKTTLTDGNQTIEIYPTTGDTHTNEYTLIYLPKSRVLVEADAFSPGPADAPAPAMPPPNAVTLADQIRDLKLNVATIAPIHGRGPVPVAELRKFIGQS